MQKNCNIEIRKILFVSSKRRNRSLRENIEKNICETRGCFSCGLIQAIKEDSEKQHFMFCGWLILLPQNQQDKRRLIKRLFFL
ncbi:hypothetical protein E6L37_11485 [Enterococcus lactis]|nr:hypothetical protein GFB66_12010 [Enterococcus faecium]TKA99172.1 hypothetical protein E6L37_11485 [Enterococcus lactis]